MPGSHRPSQPNATVRCSSPLLELGEGAAADVGQLAVVELMSAHGAETALWATSGQGGSGGLSSLPGMNLKDQTGSGPRIRGGGRCGGASDGDVMDGESRASLRRCSATSWSMW